MLKLDDCEKNIRTLQEKLAQLGFQSGRVDDTCGQKTDDGVIRFQECEGVYADGIVGPRNQGMLEQARHPWILERQFPGVESPESPPRNVCPSSAYLPTSTGTDTIASFYARMSPKLKTGCAKSQETSLTSQRCSNRRGSG